MRPAPDRVWFCLFIPALFCYIVSLTIAVNRNRTCGLISGDIVSPSGDVLIYKDTPIEVLADGFEWSEGPLWIADHQLGNGFLVFSDTVTNRVWRYDQGNGLFTVGKSVHIEKSGCSANMTRCEEIFEPGSNGITRYPFSASIDLILCQHGDRSISIIFENGTRTVIANRYMGKKLNSPNDLAWSANSDLYFTDPPYGLFDKATMADLLEEEIGFYGVYLIRNKDILSALRSGEPTDNVILLDRSMSRPNGLAFSPDYRTLYVSNSDSVYPVWVAFNVNQSTGLTHDRRVLADARMFKEEMELFSAISFPDGFKVTNEGIIISSAPGGLYMILPSGELLVKIPISRRISNVAFGENGYLYLTANDAVLRIKTAMLRGSD